MSYEYKHAIKSELKHFHENMLPVGSWKHEQKLNELDEVYAKAEAFDKIRKFYVGFIDGWISFPRGLKSFAKAVLEVMDEYEDESEVE